MGFAPLNVHVSVEKFHGIEGQNAHDQIVSGRRSKLAFMIRIYLICNPYPFSEDIQKNVSHIHVGLV